MEDWNRRIIWNLVFRSSYSDWEKPSLVSLFDRLENSHIRMEGENVRI